MLLQYVEYLKNNNYFKLDDMSESMFRKWFNTDDSDTRKQMLND